jgi:Zn-dependent peptidase ImmA (M78 family)
VAGFKAERLSYEDIRRRADTFLSKHHASGSIPIPVEEIIDLQLKLDIFPIPGLLKDIDIDGFTTSDLTCICVDDFVYNNRNSRYRFTLAHELGHIVLHEKLFESASFRKIAEWKRFYAGIPESDRSWVEYQAYAFGGLVLVPKLQLHREIPKCIALVKKHGGWVAKDASAAQDFVEECLAEKFDVSREVIFKRLDKDNQIASIRAAFQ